MSISMWRGFSPLVVLVAAFVLCIVQPCGATNLLVNPGFELGTASAEGYGPWSAVDSGWTYNLPDENTGNSSGVGQESVIGTSWGKPPTYHSGSEALRTYCTQGQALVQAYQKLAVQPEQTYQASVQVRTVGTFGSSGSDFAGMIIEQLDSSGSVIGTQQAGFSDCATEDYREASLSVSTASNAVYVRYLLQTTTQTLATAGHVTYDDCAFDGTVVTCNVSGTVTSGGAAVEGAVVTIGGQSATTNTAGYYSMSIEVVGDPAQKATATKTGYWDSVVTANLMSGPLELNIEMYPLPSSNLLTNPGFEDGVLTHYGPAYWSMMAYGWSYECLQANGGFETESTAGLYWGGDPTFHSGGQACRMYEIAETSVLRASQTVAVQSGSDYTASAWLYTQGEFGLLGDTASLNVTELDENGDEIPDGLHSVLVWDNAPDYRCISTSFTTSAETWYVKYSIDATLPVPTYYGHATWDDCCLDGPPVMCTITGTVTSGGAVVEGVTISASGYSTQTAADGTYTLEIPYGQQPTTVHAAKDGYYEAQVSKELERNTNTVDFEMVPRLYSNLLVNPSFEDGVTLTYQRAPYTTTGAGWTYEFFEGYCGIENEATSGYYWGSPSTFHDGTVACRTFQLESGGTVLIDVSQQVRVIPGQEYTAIAWVRAWGTFGTPDEDHADLIVEQLDSTGAVIDGTEVRDTIAEPSTESYTRLMKTFTTCATAYFARYRLETCTQALCYDGHVTWDDCSLEGPEVNCSLQGTVTSSGVPVEGASVSVTGGASAVTDADGRYTMITRIAQEPATITASKIAYWDTAQSVSLQPATVNTVDFDVMPRANWLENPGWEKGSVYWEITGPTFYPYDGGTYLGWKTVIPDPVVVSGLRNEKSAGANWGEAPNYKSGAGALRVYARTDSPNPPGTAHVQDMQTVKVLPEKTYDVGVWVRTVGNFGQSGDFAGFIVEQFDSAGEVISGATTTLGITDGSSNLYRQVSTQITTLPNAAAVRYTVEGKVACPYTEGYMTFDDCMFGPAGMSGSSVGDLKKSGENGYLLDKVVTAQFDGFFYIEEPDRSSGIRVAGTAEVATRVAVYGKVELIGGEPTIKPLRIETLAGGNKLAPLGMSKSATTVGLSAVGLYVTMWGRIDSVDETSFTMTDGSGTNLKVYPPADFVPAEGSYVTVTGALGSEETATKIVPVLRGVVASVVDESETVTP